ncbi:Alpha/Beta hydrolase protein [Rostrohypoxylon terebratum]|nr:Alpha/Beta hydrolase protein [Rostrohypoxylon terebratum]
MASIRLALKSALKQTKTVKYTITVVKWVGIVSISGLLVRQTVVYDNIRNSITSELDIVIQTLSNSIHRDLPLYTDPFHLIPCTNATFPPSLDDPDPFKTWASLFDPDPRHWSWGSATSSEPSPRRGLYLCGYLDLPLDYANRSDDRIVRLAVTKYQVSGQYTANSPKSNRTIIIQPGGPGGSGTNEVWQAAEHLTDLLSDGQLDVLGWDPRGVNISQPSLACFPHDSYRDHWKLLKGKYRQEVPSPRDHLKLLDAMNNATFYACHKLYGDFGRFVGTGSVARDLNEIRKALGEDQLTGYFLSYGTAIGQIYANMFPDNVGRLILDGVEYVKYYRLLGGFAQYSVTDVIRAWEEGFLGQCVTAGPDKCALAKPPKGQNNMVTIETLKNRTDTLFNSILNQPTFGYSERFGPTLVTYSQLVFSIYVALYSPRSWPDLAQMLYELEGGNSSLATAMIDDSWIDPTLPYPSHRPSSLELPWMVICADSYGSHESKDGLVWWDALWANITDQSWISSFQITTVSQCRHYRTYWPDPPDVYRGDLNNKLRNPLLLVAGTHDPATPMKNAKKLLEEMGDNARLIVHHGYGHTSREDPSDCTDYHKKAYMLGGEIPSTQEIACNATQKPFS